MSDDMLNLCKKYDSTRKIWETDDVYFFPAFESNPLSTVALWRCCSKIWKAANPATPQENLPKLRPYDFRHCFASAVIHRWLDEGRNVDAMMPFLRSYMGHSTFESTYYYVHLLPENLKHSASIDLSKFEKLLPEVEA